MTVNIEDCREIGFSLCKRVRECNIDSVVIVQLVFLSKFIKSEVNE